MKEGAQVTTKSLGLYTLGRIFEQSITELEILEAKADGRLSLNEESKRKRDGVYYTPEWVVERIVDETLGPRLEEIKAECGWPKRGDPTPEAIEAYAARLKSLTVVDPACGSGAFLITVLRYLVEAWHEVQGLRRQITKGRAARDADDTLIADILKSNIYGVDINPASVEIARLALWLHTARGDKPLSSLDENIKDGNSLIGSDFYKGQINLNFYDVVEKERVNAFDWAAAFPAVFANGGFDAVVGNPPYVKLQNFKAVHADMANFLRYGRPEIGLRPYLSTQSGNFDLYLPFIEKGIALLNEQGRLGYIAPSLWVTNEYGEGLRNLISARHHLDRWIDFKAFQVFDESITYTALQFFTKNPAPVIRIAEAPAGTIPDGPWSAPERALPYDRIKFGDRWLLAVGEERALIDRLCSTCKRLEDPQHTSNIFVGLQTSADSIFHLKRIGAGRYVCAPKGANVPAPYVVEIEDRLMKPLVSGAEAKRYVEPITETYLLFPYEVTDGRAELIDADTMAGSYPKAWAYLRSYERELRLREAKRNQSGEIVKALFDDENWYRFGRHQNLEKQEITKLIVPRLVADLGCSVDAVGSVYLDNVDVGGIAVADGEDPFFIAGVLNSRTANFVFRRVSKPFQGGYLSANKQFIAPLPIPPASPSERDDIVRGAKKLQHLHTARRDTLIKIERRLSTARTRHRPETWLFTGLRPPRELQAEAPQRLEREKKKEWAEERYKHDLAARHDAISARLMLNATLSAAFIDGEMSFAIDGQNIVDRIFVDAAQGEFILAQWKLIAATFSITEKTDGKKLANALRRLVVPDNPALVDQIIRLERELSSIELEIEAEETKVNKLVDRLYGLTEAEARLVATASNFVPAP